MVHRGVKTIVFISPDFAILGEVNIYTFSRNGAMPQAIPQASLRQALYHHVLPGRRYLGNFGTISLELRQAEQPRHWWR
jgi:hypothetical protein